VVLSIVGDVFDFFDIPTKGFLGKVMDLFKAEGGFALQGKVFDLLSFDNPSVQEFGSGLADFSIPFFRLPSMV